MKKINPVLAGLLQALGAIIYIFMVSAAMSLLERLGPQMPEVFSIAFVLTLFVFSAAVTGSLVFGYPANLALNKKVKESLKVLGYTLLFFLLFILLNIVIISII